MLAAGADAALAARETGATALHVAAQVAGAARERDGGDDGRGADADAVVAALARAGGRALVDARMGEAMHGATALYAAADAGALGAARALLAAGADADAALAGPSGATALLAAVERGDAALARALLDAGASPDKGGRGSSLHQSPLLLAVARGRTAVAQALLDAGANCGVMVVTKAGGAPESLVDLARARRNFDLLQALTAHEGCDVSWPEGEDVPSTSGEL